MSDRYYKFSRYLKEKYGDKVWKISVDAGFKCPNRGCDNRREGCIFCRIDSFSMQSEDLAVDEQIKIGMQNARERHRIRKFIVYFQASTNTAGPVSLLRQFFETAISFEGVVGLSISTRPDCLPPAVLSLIESLAHKTDVWIELGLQSTHERSLKFLNRGHTHEDFLEAVDKLKSLPVRICAHLMLGLPGEIRADQLETAKRISRLPIHEVKLHPLLILRETPLEKLYNSGQVQALTLEEYCSLACDFIEHLPPHMVLQRLTAEAPPEILIAPRWSLNKHRVLQAIERELEKRNAFQGKYFAAS